MENIRAVVVKSIDGRVSEGSFDVRRLSPRERWLAALKWLGISWAIALAFVPLPMLHFIFVPLFLVLGVPAGFFAFRVSERIGEGQVACPVCGNELKLQNVRYREKFRETCSNCANQLWFDFANLQRAR
jgi:hypothetical protein